MTHTQVRLFQLEKNLILISSETEIQRQQAIKIRNGKSSVQFNILREKLLKILSHVEAKIDFPDEDLPNDILKEIKKSSDEVLINIVKICPCNKASPSIASKTTKLIFTAFKISSMDKRIMTTFLLTRIPYIPIENNPAAAIKKG